MNPMTPTPTATATAVEVNVAAAVAVQAKIAKADATKVYGEAEAQAIAAMLTAEMETVTLPDGTKVTLKGGLEGEEARAIDFDALAERVPAATLDRVTRAVIDLAKFDAAVEIGLIDAATVAAVTTTTDKKRALVITMPKAAKR